MLLADCKHAVETGKTAKLIVPQTYAHGAEVIIRVKKIGIHFCQEVEVLSDGKSLSKRSAVGNSEWATLYHNIGGMQQRSQEWVVCDDPVEGVQ
jgi:hypothetical protein